MGFAAIEGIAEVDEATKASLIGKCQENDWVKVGGFPWQDDPYLEEYPYEFAEARSADALAGFFASGNWAIRQGVVYGDLAFIQQVDGGDEWWVLKRDGDAWLDFESASFQRSAEKSRQSFERTIASMRLASPGDCERLEYRLGERAAGEAATVMADLEEEHAVVSRDALIAETIRRIASNPGCADTVMREAEGRRSTSSMQALALAVSRKIAESAHESLDAKVEASRTAAHVLSDMRAAGRTASVQAR